MGLVAVAVAEVCRLCARVWWGSRFFQIRAGTIFYFRRGEDHSIQSRDTKLARARLGELGASAAIRTRQRIKAALLEHSERTWARSV